MSLPESEGKKYGTLLLDVDAYYILNKQRVNDIAGISTEIEATIFPPI